MIIRTSSAAETANVGAALARHLKSCGLNDAFIAMFGEMGVGKTAFTWGFCKEIGILRVKSPTYTLVNEYKSETDTVYHFDLCRLEDADELEGIGFDEYLSEKAFKICEWSERLHSLPQGAITVHISRTDNADGREIILSTEVTL